MSTQAIPSARCANASASVQLTNTTTPLTKR